MSKAVGFLECPTQPNPRKAINSDFYHFKKMYLPWELNTPQDTVEDVSTEEPEKLMFRLQSKRFRVHF